MVLESSNITHACSNCKCRNICSRGNQFCFLLAVILLKKYLRIHLIPFFVSAKGTEFLHQNFHFSKDEIKCYVFVIRFIDERWYYVLQHTTILSFFSFSFVFYVLKIFHDFPPLTLINIRERNEILLFNISKVFIHFRNLTYYY